jgi:endonuclease YncB( thermonuclease family)
MRPSIPLLTLLVSFSVSACSPDESKEPERSQQRHIVAKEPQARDVPSVPAGDEFRCTPIRVWDGDGPLWCAEGPRIRLSGIATREMDETCRPGQPCPEASATRARDNLVSLVGKPIGRSPEGHVLVEGPPLKCRSVGRARGTRTGAWCETQSGVDLSCAMVESGSALRWGRYWGRHDCG